MKTNIKIKFKKMVVTIIKKKPETPCGNSMTLCIKFDHKLNNLIVKENNNRKSYLLHKSHLYDFN